jgi:hypothetical protein
VCLFDLDYGLPVQVRDTALGIEKDEIPESAVGKEFQLNEQARAHWARAHWARPLVGWLQGVGFGSGRAGGVGGAMRVLCAVVVCACARMCVHLLSPGAHAAPRHGGAGQPSATARRGQPPGAPGLLEDPAGATP